MLGRVLFTPLVLRLLLQPRFLTLLVSLLLSPTQTVHSAANLSAVTAAINAGTVLVTTLSQPRAKVIQDTDIAPAAAHGNETNEKDDEMEST